MRIEYRLWCCVFCRPRTASVAARASSMDKQTLVAMAKRKIDEEETANAKLKEAMAAMEDTHHEERAVYNRRVAAVRAAKRDAEEKRASADEATAALQKELDAEKARAEKARTDAEAALEHDERRVANLHAKLRDAAKLEKEMEEKKNVAADAARRLRQRLAEARRGVIKVGSALLTDDGRGGDASVVKQLAGQLAALRAQGREVVLVSSGAIVAGLARLNLAERPHEVHLSQAAAAVGR